MIPVASCRTPMSEMYDSVKLPCECKTAVRLDVTVLSVTAVPTELVDGVRGSPNTLEKPTGSTMACVPVPTADIANITLTILKESTRYSMMGDFVQIYRWIFWKSLLPLEYSVGPNCVHYCCNDITKPVAFVMGKTHGHWRDRTADLGVISTTL